MKRYFRHFYLSVALTAGLLTMTGCSDDDDPEYVEGSKPMEQVRFSDDLIHGGIIYHTEYTEAEGFDIPIKTLEPVSFKICNNSDFILKTITDEDGRQHVIGSHDGAFDDDKEVLVVRGQSDKDPSNFRHFIVVVTNADKSNQVKAPTRSNASNMARAYGDFMGFGTKCFNMVGNVTYSILQSSLIPVEDQNLVSAIEMDETDMFELSGETFLNTMNTWSFNAGLSFAGMKSLSKDWKMKGCLDFEIGGKLNTSEDFEYYLNVYKVLRGEVTYNMKEFERMTTSKNVENTKAFLHYVSSGFINDVLDRENEYFDTESFFDYWGTDMISQAQIGGFRIHVHQRETNIYENSIGFDASLELKGVQSTPSDPSGGTGTTDNTKGWYDIYKAKNSPYMGGSIGGGYQSEEYFSATKQKTFAKSFGGNPSLESEPSKWIDGFNYQDNDVKWQPISYRRKSDSKLDSLWNLYPIDQMAENVLTAIENIYACVDTLKLNHNDSLILQNAHANVAKLREDRIDYISRNLRYPERGSRLVLCDVMMKYDKKVAQSGKPEPFVAKDPRNANKKRTYYPMMANKFFDKKKQTENQRGHAINTNVGCFIAGVPSGSHYWYYALAHEDDCTGIVDITFYDHLEDGFSYRGDPANMGSGLCNYPKKVCVKYFDSSRDVTSQKITAFGIFDDHKEVNNIIASTGGSELSLYATSSEEKYWNDFWKGAKDHHKWPRYAFYHGWSSIPHGIYVKYTTKDLPIKSIKNVTHPEKY